MSRTGEDTTHAEPGARRWRLLAALSPLILIAALFLSQLAALSTHRLDYPINDDWRYYSHRYGMPLELSTAWLVQPAKDTIHVTGKLLDWLFFHHVAHDYHRIAVASFFIFFGGWLVCALALCILVAQRRSATLFASLLVFALPLAGMPYWVTASERQWLEPMIAYHQMLPVVGLFALALLCVVDRSRWPHDLAVGLAMATSLFASLAYSSGAFVMMIFGGLIALLSTLAKRRCWPERSPSTSIGVAIAVVAGICLVGHVLVPLLEYQINPILEPRGHSMAYPWTSRFWIFFFALFDRAVLSTATSGAAALRGFAVAGTVLAPAIGLTILMARRRFDARGNTFAMVLIATTLAVVAYAALVSYGRAAFGSAYFLDNVPADLRASLYAHHRFFYWWISAILPLTALGWCAVLEELSTRRIAATVGFALALLLLLPKTQAPTGRFAYLRHWDFQMLYARDAEELDQIRSRDVAHSQGRAALTRRQKQWRQLPEEHQNPLYRNDRANPRRKAFYRHARELGATFTKDSALQ